MQAKFLCDKSLAVLGQTITARSTSCEGLFASVERKMGRVEKLLARVATVLDQHSTDPYLIGRVEEVVAGSIAVQVFQQMLHFRSLWPSVRDFQHQASECSGHFRRALHAYAEASLTKDAVRVAVVWRLAAMFAALFARDITGLADQLEHFRAALANCNAYHPDYHKHWVIKRALAVANLGIRLLHPAMALLEIVSPKRFRL